MKTLYKTYTRHEQCRRKQIEYEKRTGVKWDWYSIGDGKRFTAIATRDTPISEQAALALLPFLTNEGQSFARLAEASGLSLADVVSGAWTLAKGQRAVGSVNRNGHFAAVRGKFPWEKK